MLKKCYDLTRYGVTFKSQRLYDVKQVEELLNKVKTVYEENVRKRFNIGKDLLVECLSDEICLYEEFILRCLDDLELLTRALKHKAPYTERSQLVHQSASVNSVPAVWGATNKNGTTLSRYIDTIEQRMTYFNSLLHAETSAIYDLKYFNDPAKFIRIVKMQYAMSNKPAKDELWIAKVYFSCIFLFLQPGIYKKIRMFKEWIK